MEKELQHHNESLEAHLELRLDGAVRNITDLLQISGAANHIQALRRGQLSRRSGTGLISKGKSAAAS